MSVKRFPADIAFSKAIRESYNYECCHCHINGRHDTGSIHCAHIHTRKHRSTRWRAGAYPGAVALCAKCHRRFTDFPLEWAHFLCGFLGDSNYEECKRLAWETRKYTKAEQDDINEWAPILEDEENRRISAKPETTLIEQVRFNVDFMVMMVRVGRYEEAVKSVKRIHVLLNEMEAESGINSVMSL